MIPKFRAWDKRFSEFVEDFFVSEDGKIYKKSTNTGYGIAISRETSDKVILMQSTGLFDENGVEIFEGDIVKMSKDVYSEPTFYEVVRHYGGAYRLESIQHGCELWLRHTDCEVVGSIYDNPELLEDK